MSPSAKPTTRAKATSMLVALLGVPTALLVVYLSVAALSLHRAESQATEACRLFDANMAVDAYLARLHRHGFQPTYYAGHDTTDGGFIDTSFGTIAVSRYVCVVHVHQGRLASAEIRLLD
jgi:hypothetical protein